MFYVDTVQAFLCEKKKLSVLPTETNWLSESYLKLALRLHEMLKTDTK